MRQDNQSLTAIQEWLVERGIPPVKKCVDQPTMSDCHLLHLTFPNNMI